MDVSDTHYQTMKTKYNPHIPPLKRKIKKAGLLSYLFIHRGKIIRWNNDSDLIQFSTLGLNFKLADDFKSRLDKIFYDNLIKLKPHIDQIIKYGWKMKFITVHEYNLMKNFKELYDRYYQVAMNNELIHEDINNLEQAYVKISYRQSYIDSIESIFERVLKLKNSHYEENSEKIDTMLQGLNTLFLRSSLPHSLRELLLAYNIKNYNSFYKWSEIFPPITMELVQNEWYDCDRDIFYELVKYSKKIKGKLKTLKQEQVKLLRLKNNCVIDQTERPPILVRFYEKSNHNWDLDSTNFFIMYLLVIKELLPHLEQLILKEWFYINDEEKKIHKRVVDDDTLPVLYRNLKRELDLAFTQFNSDTSPVFSINDYRSDENPEQLCNSKTQTRLLKSFHDMLTTLLDISYMLLDYNDIAIESGYTKYGHLKFMLESPVSWCGKPVFSLFNYYIELIWTICGFFKHETFRDIENRLIEIQEEIGDLDSELERIDSFDTLTPDKE